MKPELCSAGCGRKTRHVSHVSGKPVCTACAARPLKPVTLASASRRPAAPKAPACRICLEPETFRQGRWAGDVVSSLKDGACADREACEARQPTLGMEIPT